jgi:hypothetical protein
LFKGLDTVRPLETLPGLSIVRIFVRMFSIPGAHRGNLRRFLFLFVQISPLALWASCKSVTQRDQKRKPNVFVIEPKRSSGDFQVFAV